MVGRRHHSLATLTCVLVLALPATAHAVSSERAVGFLNEQRTDNGIPAVSHSDDLAFGCRKHNYYMAANGFAHGEVPGMPRYSRAGAGLGRYGYNAEVLAYDGYSPSGRNPWESAPIHLYLMLDPAYRRAGYNDSDGYACMRLVNIRSAARPRFFSYPGPGTSIYRAETAAESPYTPQQLVGIPAGQRTGPNILLFSLGAGHLSSVSHRLVGPDGRVQSKLVEEDTANAIGSGFWFNGGGVLIPVRPLERDTRYTATVRWMDDGGEIHRQQFSFRTS